MPDENPLTAASDVGGYVVGGRRPCARCDRPAVARGLCATHWRADRLGIDVASDTIGTPSGFGVLGEMTRGPDFVICHECGRPFKNLGSHLRFTHAITADDYRDRHQIAGRDQLMCDDLIAKIGADSLDRVGSTEWQRFTAARDSSESRAGRELAATPLRLGARHRIGGGRRGQRTGTAPRHCTVCGIAIGGTGRDRIVCSERCRQESKVRAAGRRSADKLGEPASFHREGRPDGRRLRLAEMAAHLDVNEATLRKWVRAGRFRPHDGRDRWVAYWSVPPAPGGDGA